MESQPARRGSGIVTASLFVAFAFSALALPVHDIYGAYGKASLFDARFDIPAGDEPSSIHAADLNGDGVADLVVTDESSNSISVLLDNGDGTMATAVEYDTGARPLRVISADLDGDGAPDLIVVNADSNSISIYENAGDGSFGAQVCLDVGESPRSVRAGDLDGDGNLDLAVANAGSDDIAVLLNTGSGDFLPAAYYDVFVLIDLISADFDGDGDLDLATANGLDTITILDNSGDGTFTIDGAYAVRDTPRSLTAADLDADGDMDIAATNKDFDPGRVSILMNNGDGTFASSTDWGWFDSPGEICSYDLDGDGDTDLAVVDGIDEAVYVMRNHGDGTFAYPYERYCTAHGLRSISAGDLDGDGRLELVAANRYAGTISIFRNDGDGVFLSAPRYGVGSIAKSIVTADLDGDGDLDLATVNAGSEDISVLLNAGDGTYGAATQYRTGESEGMIQCADFDADGDLDLVVPVGDFACVDTIAIYRNRGDGTFSKGIGYAGEAYLRDIFTGDFDGDGDYDLAVLNSATELVSIFDNNGDGTFSPDASYGAGDAPKAISGADLDGDLDTDLVVCNRVSDDISILMNSGYGSFLPAVHYGAGDYPCSVWPADLDADGHIDLAVVNVSSDDVSVLINAGDGTFSGATEYAVGAEPTSIASADLDGDGDPDLAVTNDLDETISVLFNHGDGTFTETLLLGAGLNPRAVVPADLDGNGHIDLAVVNRTSNDVSIILNSPSECVDVPPSPAYPANGLLVSGTPTLRWSSPHCAGQARILLATDSGFNSIVWQRTGISNNEYFCERTSFSPGEQYWWKVALMYGSEWSEWSEPGNFMYQSPPATLPRVSPILPRDGGAVTLPEMFSCTETPEAAGYEFEFSPDTGFSSIVYRGISTSRIIHLPSNVTGMQPMNVYYWRARAIGPSGEIGEYSQVRFFVFFAEIDAPPDPCPLSPLPGASISDQSVTCTWTWDSLPVAGPTRFFLQYSLSPDFPDIEGSSWTLGPIVADSVTLDLPPDLPGTIHWRVTAENGSGIPSTGTASSFEYIPAGTPLITSARITCPTNGGLVAQSSLLVPTGFIAGYYSGPVSYQWWLDGTMISAGTATKGVSAALTVSGPVIETGTIKDYELQLRVTSPEEVVSQICTYEVPDPATAFERSLRLRCDPAHIVADGISQATVTATLVNSADEVMTNDNGTTVEFIVVDGGGTLQANSAVTVEGCASVQLQVPSTAGEAVLQAFSSGLFAEQIRIRYAENETDLLAATAEKYMEELEDLKLDVIPVLTPDSRHDYDDRGRLGDFLDTRIRISDPAPADTAALHRFVLFERALLRMYYHDPGRVTGWESGPNRPIPGALTAIDDFNRSFISLAVPLLSMATPLGAVKETIYKRFAKQLQGFLGDLIDPEGNTLYKFFKGWIASSGILPEQMNDLTSSIDEGLEMIANRLRSGSSIESLLLDYTLRIFLDERLVRSYINKPAILDIGTQADLDRALDRLEAGDCSGTLFDAVAATNARIARVASGTSWNHAQIERWRQENMNEVAVFQSLVSEHEYRIRQPWNLSNELRILELQIDILSQLIGLKDRFRNVDMWVNACVAIFDIDRQVSAAVDDAFGPSMQSCSSRAARHSAAAHPAMDIMSGESNRRLLESMSVSVSDYESTVRQIIEYAETGDSAAVILMEEEFSRIQSALLKNRRRAMAPFIAGAWTGYSEMDGFDRLYTSALGSSDRAGLHQAMFCVALRQYLVDPNNPLSVPMVRDMGIDAIEYTIVADDSIRSAVTSVIGDSAVSLVICDGVILPDSVIVGEQFAISVTVLALGGAPASDAFIRLSTDSATVLAGPDSIQLGTLAPGEDSVVTFFLTMTENGMSPVDSTTFGMIDLIPGSKNGYGMSECVFPAATRAIVTSTTDNDQPAIRRELLYPPFPNPFNPSTMIRFDMAANGWVRIGIVDIQGRRIRILEDSRLAAGSHTVIWDGKNDSGIPVATGMYFCTMTTRDGLHTRKLVLLR